MNTPTAPSKPRPIVHVGVVIPLEEEWKALQDTFSHVETISTQPLIEELVSGHPDIRLVAILQDDMGKTAAARAADALLERFDLRLLVCLGIAGGISSDYTIGDVCTSTRVIDVYDNAKASDDQNGEISLALSPTRYETPLRISSAADVIRRERTLRSTFEGWQTSRYDSQEGSILREGDIISRPPKVSAGVIACGVVSASAKYNAKLQEVDRKIAVVETEAGGIFDRAQRAGCDAWAVRGVSDLADKNKSSLESATAGLARYYAAANAASFLKLQICDNSTLQHELIDPTKADTPTQVAVQQPTIHEYVQKLGSHIHDRLTELLPDYRLRKKGYVLPLPRVRQITYDAKISRHRLSDDAKEVVECLENSQHMFISIDPSYPEKGLPWVVADELLRREHNGKQIIPIVVSGDSTKPPRGTIEYAADLPTTDPLPDFSLDDVQPVVIFDGLPLLKRSRMKFIIEEIRNHPNTRFIYLDRTPSNIVLENEFVGTLGCQTYELCAVSFRQMVHFVEKNFDVETSEANVIALRLQKTFQEFKLSAHPTYFMGIEQNIIAQLIQANRRAELMELAVVGFLSFVVAGDSSNIQLSRRTRERFLRSLVIDLRVQKRSFTESELVEYVRQFTRERDFAVEPFAFIKGFVDHNVLNFSSGTVDFSLPFLEHYLLACALRDTPDLAKAYFCSTLESVDVPTFDLYCEIGPSQEVVDWVMKELNDSLLAASANGDSKSIFLSPDIDAKLNIQPRKSEIVGRRIKNLSTAIREGKDETGEKQAQLDSIDRIGRHVQRARLEETSPTAADDSAIEDNSEIMDGGFDPIVTLGYHWELSVIMIGASSEQLNASEKRSLVGSILSGMNILLSDSMEFFLDLDYDALKKDILDDDGARDALEVAAKANDGDGNIERYVSDTVDALKFLLFASPFYRAIHILCDRAREKVLARSIGEADINGHMEKLLRAVWLSDIDVDAGKPFLDTELRRLPRTTLPRLLLASHFIERVYWTHAAKGDRLHMLDRAAEVIQGTNLNISKPELKRLVDKSKEEFSDDGRQ